MNKGLKTLLSGNIKTDVASQGKQLSSCLNIKDKIEFQHKHDLLYHAECPEENCNDDYVGEVERCISERVIDHSGRDNYILNTKLKNTLVNNTRILKLVVVSIITLRRKTWQKCCGLTHLCFFPKQEGEVCSSKAF